MRYDHLFIYPGQFLKNYKKELITSYGILLFHIDSDCRILYLLAQRRDSVEYSDYLRGIYSYSNMKNYFKLMTIEERFRLSNNTFDDLWDDLWIKHDHDYYKNYKPKAKEKFFLNYEYMLTYLKNTTSTIQEPLWGFPKGKKNINESEIKCAFREFKEESSLSIDYLNLLNLNPSQEIFKGSNGKMYSTIYYIAQTENKLPFNKIKLNGLRSETISEEISNLKWCTLEEAIEILPNWRKKLIFETDSKIKEFLKQK